MFLHNVPVIFINLFECSSYYTSFALYADVLIEYAPSSLTYRERHVHIPHIDIYKEIPMCGLFFHGIFFHFYARTASNSMSTYTAFVSYERFGYAASNFPLSDTP